MGVVWLARDEVPHRDVAVKEIVPPPRLPPGGQDAMRRRTRREARAAARLSHPNVVRVYDVLDGPDAPWIVMEYVQARSLERVIAEDGLLAIPRAGSGRLGAHRGPDHRSADPVPTGQPPAVAAPAEPAVPAGWWLHRDPTGFVVAVPDGWTVSREGTIVYFREPNGSRVLGIDQTDRPKADPVADWTAQDSYRVRRGDFPRYERIGISRCDHFLACADWEFRYTRNGVRGHVNNRGLVASSRKAYGIWWSTADSQWAQSPPYLRTVYRTLRPAG